MIIETFSIHDAHREIAFLSRYGRFAFMVPHGSGVLDDLARELAQSGIWPSLPEKTRRLAPTRHTSTELELVRYFAIGSYEFDDASPWYGDPEKIRITIAHFCEGLDRLPLPKDDQNPIGVVFNPFKIPGNTPIPPEYIRQQLHEACRRKIAWFMR